MSRRWTGRARVVVVTVLLAGCAGDQSPPPLDDEGVRDLIESSQSESPSPVLVEATAELERALPPIDLDYLLHLDWSSVTPTQVAFDPAVRRAMEALEPHALEYRRRVDDIGMTSSPLCAEDDVACMTFLAHAQLVLGAVAVLGVAWGCPPCAVAGIVIGLSVGDVSAAELPPTGEPADPVLLECLEGGTPALDCLDAQPIAETGCPDGYEDCGEGFCVNLQAAYRDCGSCGNRCASGRCVEAACTEPVPTPAATPDGVYRIAPVGPGGEPAAECLGMGVSVEPDTIGRVVAAFTNCDAGEGSGIYDRWTVTSTGEGVYRVSAAEPLRDTVDHCLGVDAEIFPNPEIVGVNVGGYHRCDDASHNRWRFTSTGGADVRISAVGPSDTVADLCLATWISPDPYTLGPGIFGFAATTLFDCANGGSRPGVLHNRWRLEPAP